MKKAGRCLALLCLVFPAAARAGAPARAEAAQPPQPLIVYYSLTGTTRTIAEELARALSLPVGEIRSEKYRQGFWKVTCVNDQLFDRDDILAPVPAGLARHPRLIIAAPVWIHALASPMRTLIKYHGFKNRRVWLVLTNQGNYGPADEQAVRGFLQDWGVTVAGCSAVCTAGLSGRDLQRRARLIARDIAARWLSGPPADRPQARPGLPAGK